MHVFRSHLFMCVFDLEGIGLFTMLSLPVHERGILSTYSDSL